jgi:segregation and condensation protein A
MEQMISLLRGGRHVAFSSLFTPESHRGEVIVTFLALLELLRLRQISLYQNDAFHEIIIMPAEGAQQERIQPPVIGGGEHVGF